MAQLFVQDASNLWSAFRLTEDVYRLSLAAPHKDATHESQRATRSLRSPIVEPDRVERLSREGALLVRHVGAGNASRTPDSPTSSAQWAVLTGSGTPLRINGVAIPVGIAALRHRDELCIEGGAPLYFSSERLVSVETYCDDDSPRCPRCTLPIERGDAYVCCPDCHVVHHQLPERECWSYMPTCSQCPQSSDLKAGYRWSPEGL